MDELIPRLAAKTGLDGATLTKAVTLILVFLNKEGPTSAVAQFTDAIKGSRDLVNEAEGSPDPGLAGALGGMFGHMGSGLTGLGGSLMAMGINIGQAQTIGQELFAYGGEKAGPEVVGKIVSEIPGLEQFVFV